MKDRVVQFPHRYQLVPVAGQTNVYDFVPVTGTVTEVGTPINKANLLKDETAALYDLTGEDATVDGALARAFSKPLEDRRKCAGLSEGAALIATSGYVSFSTVDQNDYLGAIDIFTYPTRLTIPTGVSHVRFSVYIFDMYRQSCVLELHRNGSLFEEVASNSRTSGNDKKVGWRHTNVISVSAGEYFQLYFSHDSSGELKAGTKFQMEVI